MINSELTKLDELLFAKYPELLRQYKLSPKETCLCWGIVPGPGWANLVADMCAELDDLRKNECPDLQLSQSKEKFGLLRVYLDNWNDKANEITDRYEALSCAVCIRCGGGGKLIQRGWFRVHCDTCEALYQKGK